MSRTLEDSDGTDRATGRTCFKLGAETNDEDKNKGVSTITTASVDFRLSSNLCTAEEGAAR